MNKKSTIYLAVLIILVIVFLIIKTNDKTERRIRFFDVDSTRIGAIEIFTSEDTLKLVKSAERWMIDHPVKFPPTQRKIKDLFDRVIPVETSRIPVSESESAFETYNVTDSLGTAVKIYDEKGKELIFAYIGKSSNYNYSHGRYNNASEVYQLYDNISSILIPRSDNWRNKEIIKLEEDPAEIKVFSPERSYTISATDSLWHYTEGDSSFFISQNNRSLNTLLDNSRTFRISSFIDNEYEIYADKFDNPKLTVQLKLYSGDEIILKFVAKDEESKQYVVQKNDETDFLYVVFDNIYRYFQPAISDLKK
jgi:hypothetical protein